MLLGSENLCNVASGGSDDKKQTLVETSDYVKDRLTESGT